MMLQDKVAVIYGAGGAIGGAVAHAFAAEGARLFLTGRHRAPVEIVAKDIVSAGGSAEVAEVDALDEQVGEGAHPEDVAAALGLHRKTVYGWLAKYREGGKGALAARPVPGRPPKLAGPQMSRLYGLIVGQDPRQMQFEFALWTREMIREVIRREFGVRLSVVSVGRLLRKLGLSPQRPLHRAYQQSPEAVDRWKREEYPAIRAQAEAEGATIWFADEAGIRSDYHAGTTWAPIGQTPEVKNTGARYAVNMISVLSANGTLRFAGEE